MEGVSNSLKPPLHKSSSPRDKESDDTAKLLEWQEQRIARKLRGEYESAVLHLADIINSNLFSPMGIASVRVEGAKFTRSSFLGFLINPLLFASCSPNSESNLESVLHTTRRISSILQNTNNFHSVEARIERARDSLATEGDVDIIFKTRERGRLYLNTSTELGNNEGSAAATARIRNVFGGAETFEANLSFGTRTRRSFRASLTVPLTPDLQTYGEMTAFGLERDNSTFASCTEGLRGIKAIIRRGTQDTGTNEFAYEAILRHIGGLTPTASVSMRESAGETLKSSISHTYVLDSRDEHLTTSRGLYAKFFHEFAGLGGDASFYKIEAESQICRPVLDGISLSLSARTGLLWGISRPTLFSDRFQLGGPTSMRAFKANGMGPRDGPDYLGGDIYWSAGASVISNIPWAADWPIKSHLWLNVGRLDTVVHSQSLLDNVRNTIIRPCISAGTGIIYRFDPVRVEINFGVPLVASKSDNVRRGIQVGIGLEFL